MALSLPLFNCSETTVKLQLYRALFLGLFTFGLCRSTYKEKIQIVERYYEYKTILALSDRICVSPTYIYHQKNCKKNNRKQSAGN